MGKIEPYIKNPTPPTVCLLTHTGEVLSEHGDTVSLDLLPSGFRVWCSYDTVRALLWAGKGEALCWNREEIRWRHRPFENGWKRRPSDVAVIKLPFYEDNPMRTLRALAAWRDWLADNGASPTGTTGGAAWSLLRAMLAQPLWTSVGARPPLRQTLGGRQELGPAGQGTFEGKLAQWDLPAAYATELGNIRYGGRWVNTADMPITKPAEWWARDSRPVFVRAVVNIPNNLRYGPLPKRTAKPVHGLMSILLGAHYPTGKRMQGVWTWPELEAAEYAGCRIVKILDVWAHLAGDCQPFLPWWNAIQEGRKMPGLAGLLAKTTGNALWGRFCMDNQSNGERTIRRLHGKEMRVRGLPLHGGLPPAHDLAETVSGRTRARLYRLMVAAGDNLISCHTDGAWLYPLPEPLQDWRVKAHATRIDLLDPQVLRYWGAKGDRPRVVYSGVTASEADTAFETAWANQGFANV